MMKIKRFVPMILALTMLAPTATPVTAEENAQATESVVSVKLNGPHKNPKTGKWCYYKNGKINKKYNSIAKIGKNWWKFTKGVIDKKYTGIAKRAENGKYYYIRKGKLDKKYTGIAKIPGTKKWYRVEKGKVNLKYTGVAKRPETGKYYYLRKGKIDWKYSGTAKDPKTGKKYTVTKGKAKAKKSKNSSKAVTGKSPSEITNENIGEKLGFVGQETHFGIVWDFAYEDSSLEVKTGESKYLPEFINHTGKTTSFSSSNTKVAVVNSKGKITGKSKGEAVITVKAGGLRIKCYVTCRGKKNPLYTKMDTYMTDEWALKLVGRKLKGMTSDEYRDYKNVVKKKVGIVTTKAYLESYLKWCKKYLSTGQDEFFQTSVWENGVEYKGTTWAKKLTEADKAKYNYTHISLPKSHNEETSKLREQIEKYKYKNAYIIQTPDLTETVLNKYGRTSKFASFKNSEFYPGEINDDEYI